MAVSVMEFTSTTLNNVLVEKILLQKPNLKIVVLTYIIQLLPMFPVFFNPRCPSAGTVKSCSPSIAIVGKAENPCDLKPNCNH